MLLEDAIPDFYFIHPAWQIVLKCAWPSSSAAAPGVNDLLGFLIHGGQLQPTGKPLNLLRTCLRAELVCTYNEMGDRIDFTARHCLLTYLLTYLLTPHSRVLLE